MRRAVLDTQPSGLGRDLLDIRHHDRGGDNRFVDTELKSWKSWDALRPTQPRSGGACCFRRYHHAIARRLQPIRARPGRLLRAVPKDVRNVRRNARVARACAWAGPGVERSAIGSAGADGALETNSAFDRPPPLSRAKPDVRRMR